MALRCLSSIKVNNSIFKCVQLTSEAMTAIFGTDRTAYDWYNDTSSAPNQYITDYGDSLFDDLCGRTWVSSGQTNYTIENSNNSYIYFGADTQLSNRDVIGILPTNYTGSSRIFGRYQQGEINYLDYHFGVILDDENERAVIFMYTQRVGGNYSTFYRISVWTEIGYRYGLYLDFSNSEPISYQWQSVPSISGKNGILLLPVLVSTDGEPVSSGSASDFSTLPSGAIVRTLADSNL